MCKHASATARSPPERAVTKSACCFALASEFAGAIEYPADAASGDDMFEAAIEAGAEDCESDENGHELFCGAEDLHSVSQALEASFGAPLSAKIIWKAQNNIELDDEAGVKLLRMLDALEDNDDVQNVYANFEVSDAVLEQMS